MRRRYSSSLRSAFFFLSESQAGMFLPPDTVYTCKGTEQRQHQGHGYRSMPEVLATAPACRHRAAARRRQPAAAGNRTVDPRAICMTP